MTAAVLAGLGGWVPPTSVANHELAPTLGITDDWIRRRTGIGNRHVITPGMATSDLAIEAGARALKSAARDRADAVVLATTTPDHPVPATAPAVAAGLDLTPAAAFDLNAVCTGFVYGLAVSAALISAGAADSVLLIGADTFSTILNPDDQSTRPVFGDGAGAVVLRAGEPGEPGALLGFDLGSDGTHADLIMVPAGGSRQRSTGQPPPAQDTYFAMAGRQVFTKAVSHMAESSRAVLRRAGQHAGELDRVVGHQANLRILHAVAEQLDLPHHKLVANIDRVGNTSAASIPLALADAATDGGSLRADQLVLLTAFGGGLTWGSALLRWPDVQSTGIY